MTDQEMTRNDEMARNGWNMGSFLSGFFIGGLIGAATAILVAPQSGENTRTMMRDKGIEVRDKGIELKDKAVATAEETRAQAEELARTVQERTEEITRQGRERIEEEKDRLKSTVETIK
jgi:gas vesicle protein